MKQYMKHTLRKLEKDGIVYCKPIVDFNYREYDVSNRLVLCDTLKHVIVIVFILVLFSFFLSRRTYRQKLFIPSEKFVALKVYSRFLNPLSHGRNVNSSGKFFCVLQESHRVVLR